MPFFAAQRATTEWLLVKGIFTIPYIRMAQGPDTIRPSSRGNDPGPSDFIGGPENDLLRILCAQLLRGKPVPSPLVVYGNTGAGKTHLVEALSASFSSFWAHATVLTMTGADFCRKHATAAKENKLVSCRKAFRTADLLILDNLQEVATKRASQSELRHTIDALHTLGSRVVITSGKAPHDLTKLLPDLTSRLSEGLTLKLNPPGKVARETILRQIALARNLPLDNGAARILSQAVLKNVPRLQQALSELNLVAQTRNGRIDAQMARQYAAQQITTRTVEMSLICTTVARHYGLKIKDLKGSSRSRSIVSARSIAMFLAREMSHKPLSQIGNHFGGRDHTTVLHACKKIEGLRSTDPITEKTIHQLQDTLSVL